MNRTSVLYQLSLLSDLCGNDVRLHKGCSKSSDLHVNKTLLSDFLGKQLKSQKHLESYRVFWGLYTPNSNRYQHYLSSGICGATSAAPRSMRPFLKVTMWSLMVEFFFRLTSKEWLVSMLGLCC